MGNTIFSVINVRNVRQYIFQQLTVLRNENKNVRNVIKFQNITFLTKRK